jgi:hypothetical protein
VLSDEISVLEPLNNPLGTDVISVKSTEPLDVK